MVRRRHLNPRFQFLSLFKRQHQHPQRLHRAWPHSRPQAEATSAAGTHALSPSSSYSVPSKGCPCLQHTHIPHIRSALCLRRTGTSARIQPFVCPTFSHFTCRLQFSAHGCAASWASWRTRSKTRAEGDWGCVACGEYTRCAARMQSVFVSRRFSASTDKCSFDADCVAGCSVIRSDNRQSDTLLASLAACSTPLFGTRCLHPNTRSLCGACYSWVWLHHIL